MTGFAAIENAIVAHIAAANAAGGLGYRLKTIASYGGQFDADIVKIAIQFPAVYVTFGGEPRPTAIGGGQFEHRPVFALIIGTRNARNEGATRHGSGAETGSFQIIADIRAMLAGQALGLPIDPLQPGRIASLFNGQVKKEKLSLMSMEIHTRYIDGGIDAANLDDLKTVHAAWDVPVHGNITNPAGPGDATDDITGLEI